MNKNIIVRYWVNVGGLYSESLASIYNKEIEISNSTNEVITVVEDRFVGYFGSINNSVEKAKEIAKERWYDKLNSLLVQKDVKAKVDSGIKLMKIHDYLKSLKIEQITYNIDDAVITINIELDYSNNVIRGEI